jgi:hypothetical protein
VLGLAAELPAPTSAPSRLFRPFSSSVGDGRADAMGFGASFVEAIEKLEPAIGLEPMTCRLRSEGRARHAPTSAGNYLINLA